MSKYTCAIQYIENTNFSREEKDRLTNLHNSLFEEIYDSKIFTKHEYPSGKTIIIGKGDKAGARRAKIAEVIKNLNLPPNIISIESLGNPIRKGTVDTVVVNVLPLANPSKLNKGIPKTFQRDLDFFNKDAALLEQEQKELDNFTLEEDIKEETKPIVDNKGQGKLFQLSNITPALIEEEKQKFEKEGITLNQKNNIGIINKLLYRTITPATYNLKSILTKGMYSLFVGRSYEDFVKTLKVLADLDIPVPKLFNKIDKEQYNKRDDAWALSNGLPQKHNTFKYVGKGFIRNGEIILDVNGEDIYDFTNPVFDDVDINKVFKKGFAVDKGNYVMGSYGISIGRDETGYFMKYTDRWDLDVTNNFAQKIIDITQKPFIVSGKLYKALTYDELGNPQIYYTSVSTNSDINNYIEFMAMIGTEEEITLDNTYNPSSYQTAATQKTINAIKELLTNLGISLEKVDTLVEEFGVNGIAEFSDMIIKIQSGMENVALTEEFMHFVSVMIPDNLLEDLMSNIESYEIYKLVFEQYKKHPAYQNEDGSPNTNKIKIEAVGKLLAEYYIMKAEGLTPEEVNIAKTLWNRIKDWLKGLFTNQTNAFADLIDKLNSGELLLDDTSISRYDKLLQLTETNASKIVSFLQKDFQKEDLTKYDTNIERINNFLDLIKDFKEQDLPFILSKSKGVGVVKDTFAQSRYFLKDIEDKDTLKDALTNAVNYMRSSYNASVTLGNRVAVIKKELKEIETKEYEKTEEKHKEIRFKNLELSNIQKILETYKDEFNDLYNMFSEEDSGELIDFLKEAIGQVDSTLVVVGNQLKVQAFEQLRKEFSKKERNIRIRLEEEIHSQKQQLEQAATESMKQRHRDKIEVLERELSNPSLTFNKLIKLLEQGEEKNNWFFRLIEGPLTSSNEVIQLITNQLEDVISDITKEHQGQLIELKNIFQGRIQNIQDTAYDKYIHEAKKYKFSIETGDLIETHHLELVSNVDQTAFENDIEILKYLKTVPFFKALERYEEEIGGKFTNIRFTEKNQEEFLSDLIKNIYANHAEEKYTEEYRKIYDILNTTISTGESVKELRSKVNDQLRKAKSLLDSVVGTNDFELYMEDIRELDAQLLEMELFYDKDGNKKTGDSLLIAKTIDKWKQAKQKASEEGKPLYKNFITHTAQITWEEQKRKIDEKYEADPVKHEKERNDWYALNVTVKEDPKFIEERNNIYKAINIVLSKYDSSEFNEANKAIDDIRKLLRAVLRKYTVEGTVNGNNATTEEQLFVKNKEKELNYLKDEIRKNKENLTAKDYETLQVLFSDLEKIQTEGVTEHWLQALSLLGTNLSQDDLLQNQFVRNNTINVTDKYMGKALPQGYLVSSDNEIFAPTMLWRNTIPTDPEYKREQVPSFKWHSSRVNEIYENEKTITDNRKVKATSSIYANAKYGQLTSDEILFVENVRKKYYADQMRKPVTMRLGDTLPFMQKSGIQKTAKGIKNIFSPDTYKAITAERFLGKDFRENVLGEGKEDKSRKVDINSYSYKFKYASDSNDMLSQERDLYKLLKAYNYEAIKYDRMKMLLPELNSVRKVIVNSLQKNKNNTNLLKDVDIFVEKAINKKTTRENTPLASFVRKFTSKMRSLTANVFLRLPWLYTGSIKSLVANAYFTFTNHSFLKQFSEGSLLKGYKSAAGRLIDYSYNEYKLVPSKYTAIMKRLRLIEDDTLNKDLDANTNILLKIANNMGYAASLGHRQAFERYAMFAMSEMYFQTLSKEIEDFYEYDEKTGTVTLKEGENLDENKITSDVRDMAQFTLGNYNPANDPILKHTALGQILMFFGNHIPNGIISRVGPGTTLRSGVEVKPYMAFWKADVRKIYLDLFKGLMSMDALTILKHKHLTATEKNVLFRFYKDFLLTNLLGASYYIISKAMQESGDDDDDELSWYALMVFRKAYSEMSYFNPVEKAGIPLRLLTDEKFGYKGNSIQKTFDYVIGKKAVEMLTPSIFPGDYRGLRFDTEDIKTKDPYYAQYKNNLLLYNFHRYTRTKAFFDYKYGKQAIKGFEYFDKSIYQYEKDKK